MSGTYNCPDCDGRVLHYCHPPSYWRGRSLPRFPGLRRLRRLPEVEGTTLEENRHAPFADFAGGYQPPTPEEAREETGETGRRKDGTGRRTTPVDDPWIRELDL